MKKTDLYYRFVLLGGTMIPVTVRILVCVEPVDMRRGFDGLALIARQKLEQDPQSGALLIFTSRRRDRLNALWWAGCRAGSGAAGAAGAA